MKAGGKKDKGKKKGGGDAPIVIDPSQYIREAKALPVLGGVSAISTPLSGNYYNVENLFDVWNIDGEPWNDYPEFDPSREVSYPNHISSTGVKRLREILKLPEDNEKGGKGKKPAKNELPFDDATVDDEGRSLPRIFIEPEEQIFDYNEFTIPREFSRRQKTAVTEDSTDAAETHYIDELMCNAFKIVEQFLPNIATKSNSSHDVPYLWKSIYPQLPNGKPCYNRSGRYCIKLFLAGKWRKVVINDSLPVNENDDIALASSSSKFELWPTLLSKAVYTVYTACGFKDVLNDLDTSKCQKSLALSASSFVSFVIHTLTGWLPSAPWSLSEVFNSDKERFHGMISEIKFGGALTVSPDEIPTSEAIRFKSVAQMCSHGKKTRKQLKDEYRKRLVEKENILDLLNERESQIAKISSAVTKPFTEVFLLSVLSKEGFKVLPVLAFCEDVNESGEQQLKVLTKWRATARYDSRDLLAASGINSDAPPISTELDYEWVDVTELCVNMYTYVMGVDTKINSSVSCDLSWHWSNVEEESKDPKNKGKGKEKEKPKDNKKGSNPASIGVASTGSDQGTFLPYILKINPEKIFTEDDHSQLQGHLPLSVLVQADLCSIAEKEYAVPDDAVLILQEIRSDNEVPLVMRVQFCKANLFPICRTTFQIPFSRICNRPLLFWVRLFTSSSLYISFSSAVELEIGDANVVWEKTGGSAFVQEGVSLPSFEKTEHVLFRCPLQAASQDQDSALIFFQTSDREIFKSISLFQVGQNESTSLVSNCVKVKLDNSSPTIVVGRLYHPSLNIPEFKWKLIVLTQAPLTPPLNIISSIPNSSPIQRYCGNYIANNKLLLFEDVYAFGLDEFPVAMKISTQTMDNAPALETILDPVEDIWFNVRLFRKTDRFLVKEFASRGALQLYWIEKQCFLSEDGINTTSTTKAGAKKDEKGKKGKGEGPSIEFIVQCRLDETRMKVPNEWRSRFPYKFNYENTTQPNSSPWFVWNVDILSGKVIQVQHNIAELERYAVIKNKWEQEDPGRRDRALSALNYSKLFLGRNFNSDERVAELSNALGKEEEMVKLREEILPQLQLYKEHIFPCSDNSIPTLLAVNVVEHEKQLAIRDKECADEAARQALLLLQEYNEKVRKSVTERIADIKQTINTNYSESITAWKLREEYNVDIKKKNESLKYLRQRAEAAIEEVRAKEEGIADKKGGKGKKNPPPKKK